MIKIMWSFRKLAVGIFVLIVCVIVILYFFYQESSQIDIDTQNNNPSVVYETKNIMETPIKITLITPLENSVWKFNSAQIISWSLAGIPQGNFHSVIFLVANDESRSLSGSIIEKDSKEGVDSATYNVGIINVGSDAPTSIQAGSYNVVFRIYQIPEGPPLGYGKLVTEKVVGSVTIK